jgi:hypothetical protein
LTIKDPTFVSVHENDYSFYFGKVSVRALTKCKESNNLHHDYKNLCALEHTRSLKIDIGLRTDEKIGANQITAGKSSTLFLR